MDRRAKDQWQTAVCDVTGFTLLEMIFVLFLMVALLGLVIPRITFGDNLSTVGRRLVGTIRALQGMATLAQKPVHLYIDMDHGTYWPMVLEGKEEKVPLDAAWSTPIPLPESVRITEFTAAQGTKTNGRADLWLYPSGRIDPVTIHLADGAANILAIAVEPVTGSIRVSDQRIEPLKPPPIPDRVKPYLQPLPLGGAPVPAGLRP
ncbi:MAG TPA: type II secretion system protein [Nitrospiraceae bacterium]|nr:type II secretion system protein [Nitrospiraceae bacterium]